jgi:hypothetical protein
MAPADAALLEAIYPGLSGVYKDQQDPNPRLRAWLSGWEAWRAEGAHVFKLRDGKVVRLEIFASRKRAMEQRLRPLETQEQRGTHEQYGRRESGGASAGDR